VKLPMISSVWGGGEGVLLFIIYILFYDACMSL
jgi:hypothetical protein